MVPPLPVNEHPGDIAPNAGGAAGGSRIQLMVALSVALTVAVTEDVYQPLAPFGAEGFREIVETGESVISRITLLSWSAIRRPPFVAGATAAGVNRDAEAAGPPSPA
jgi:hypothetical protein